MNLNFKYSMICCQNEHFINQNTILQIHIYMLDLPRYTSKGNFSSLLHRNGLSMHRCRIIIIISIHTKVFLLVKERSIHLFICIKQNIGAARR